MPPHIFLHSRTRLQGQWTWLLLPFVLGNGITGSLCEHKSWHFVYRWPLWESYLLMISLNNIETVRRVKKSQWREILIQRKEMWKWNLRQTSPTRHPPDAHRTKPEQNWSLEHLEAARLGKAGLKITSSLKQPPFGCVSLIRTTQPWSLAMVSQSSKRLKNCCSGTTPSAVGLRKRERRG